MWKTHTLEKKRVPKTGLLLSQDKYYNTTYPLKSRRPELEVDFCILTFETIFRQLNLDNNCPVFLSIPLASRPDLNERFPQILFETFNIPALGLRYQSEMAGYYYYKEQSETFLSVYVGDKYCEVLPFFGKSIIYPAARHSETAGGLVTDYLSRLITEEGHAFDSTREMNFVIDMKEKHCYVTLDYLGEFRKYNQNPASIDVSYGLPDGYSCDIRSQRFRASEALFKPYLADRSRSPFGISQLINESIMACEIDLRSDLWKNICLSGGTTKIQGFKERLEKDLMELSPCPDRVRIRRAVGEEDTIVWQGGTTAIEQPLMYRSLISKEEYDESGVHMSSYNRNFVC